MGQCVQCENEYDKSFSVKMPDGQSYEFDCFQCAITKLAPRCSQCSAIMVGPGFETEKDDYYCCQQCAEAADAKLESDHAG